MKKVLPLINLKANEGGNIIFEIVTLLIECQKFRSSNR